MKTTRAYPRVEVDTASVPAVGQAGGVLLTETIAATGLGAELSEALAPWRKPLAVHDPAKVITDLAACLALGGDTLSDVALLRAEPDLYGPVASDPTVSRTIDALATDATAALRAINTARAAARTRAWSLAGEHAPDHETSAKSPLIIDVDATLVTSHSDKERAGATFKRGYGFHPLCAFLDHGHEGSGEPLALMLRAGNAGSNTAADHITVIRDALRQLPGYRRGTRAGRKVLIRTDGAGCTHDVIEWMHGQRLSYSVGFTLPAETPELLELIPQDVWQPALDANDQIRDGAWVAELTDLLDLTGWPPGMRVIARKERPHPGAQLRITDIDGHRVTAFATNTRPGGPGTQLANLELRHRRRARCEDRIRTAKDTGLRAFPLHDFAQNQIWLAIVALAAEITAWMQMLALTTHDARRWEPKRLRLRIFTIPATIARHARRTVLHLADTAPWASLAHQGLRRLRRLAAPG
ncbi:IS1380 family transposase [Georgenia satyanarayanai]|uniref:IS1380 family transposase n=1 Tax=Georgenia satyanarayanai TaxID=860221 RepID=UPI002041D504|nr:IS1380 family transposase [Georgenia satyanarayanai]MCM3662377.1 IS1380 family transposase [Georgenia satyanarayanai]